MCSFLTVRLGDSFQLILLLDSIRGGGTLGSVDQFFGQSFGDGLDVSEGGFSGTDGQQGDGLVDSSQWRDIDGLSSGSTTTTDSGGVFSLSLIHI